MRNIILFILSAILFTSCSNTEEKAIKNQPSGILKVVGVKTENSKMCIYTIEGKDLQSELGYFNIECECDKFNANSRLELKAIDEKKVDSDKVFYFITQTDSLETVTTIPLNDISTPVIKLLESKAEILQLQIDIIADKDSINDTQKQLIINYKSEIDSLTKLTTNTPKK